MIDPNKNYELSFFLKKAEQLRGFGDMNSYYLLREFKALQNISEAKVTNIIEDLASAQTWNKGKTNFIKTILENITDNKINGLEAVK